ncbi:MAG: hypothetical protein JKY48_05385 [Flavobacteriales bacterium]|nr:hypothetical protein [Flavobacteriales bacterium]
MKRLNPYSTQIIINLVLGIIGIVGILVILSKFIFNLEMEIIGLSTYPFFTIYLYQYFQLKKKHISFSSNKIEWNLLTSNGLKSFDFNPEELKVESNWKGLFFRDGESIYEISLDGIWKKDRERIAEELKALEAA